MAERNRPSADWYRRKVFAMPDHDYVIGPVMDLTAQQESERASSVSVAFGALVRLERRNQKLTVAELASKLDVEEAEIRNIEHDPTFRARPRTVVGIANFFDLPLKEVKKLSGTVAANDKQFVDVAMKFAARSDDIGSLTEDERKLLKSFLEYLRDKSQEG